MLQATVPSKQAAPLSIEASLLMDRRCYLKSSRPFRPVPHREVVSGKRVNHLATPHRCQLTISVASSD